MSKPVFDDLFRFHGRRNRRSYALVSLALWSLFIVATALLVLIGAAASETIGTTVAVLWLVGLIPFAWAGVAVTAQRCRDANWTGWIGLLALVPYVSLLLGLALCFVPGSFGTNRYGTDPLAPGELDFGRLHARAA